MSLESGNRSFGPAALLAIVWTATPPLLGFLLLAKVGPVGEWLRANGVAGMAAYTALFIVASGLGFLPTYAQSLLGGWVFGVTVGLPLALAGFLGGALLGFVVAHLIAGDALRRRLATSPKAAAIGDSLVGRGFWRTVLSVFLLRLPPTSPFSLMNLAMASGGVRLAPYTLGTLTGMTPRTAVAVAAAAAGSAGGARDFQELARTTPTWQVVAGIVATIAVLVVLGEIGKRALARAGLGKVA